MGIIKTDKQGFTVIEAVVVLGVIILLAVVGWIAHDQKSAAPSATTVAIKTNVTSTNSSSHQSATAPPAIATQKVAPINLPTGPNSTSQGLKTYDYPGGYFSFSYPSTWIFSAKTQPGASSLSPLITISPPGAVQAEAATVTAYRSASLASALNQNFSGSGTTVENSQSLTINGYNAVYQQNVISDSFVDDTYALASGKTTVVISFRVSQDASADNGLSNYVANGLLPQFNDIIASLKF
jgi:hypothetical protein